MANIGHLQQIHHVILYNFLYFISNWLENCYIIYFIYFDITFRNKIMPLTLSWQFLLYKNVKQLKISYIGIKLYQQYSDDSKIFSFDMGIFFSY